MNGLHPALQAIIKKKLPVKLRREETALMQEIDDQGGFLKDTRVTIIYDSGDTQIKYNLHHCSLPIEARQLIDMILRGWSTVEQIKVLQEQLRGYNDMHPNNRKS
ncbi:MAG: hypothetical protein QX196_07260 [Methylococcaceae bacterium]